MRRRHLPAAALAAGALIASLPATASAAVPHTVQPGETLWTIAAANNLYTGALAAYNGMSPDAQVVLGSTIMVPTAAEALPKVNEAIAAGAPQPSGVVIASPPQPAAAASM